MLVVHYALLMVFGVYNWREAFEYNAQWFFLALVSGPVLGLAGAASARFRWFDLFAALGFFLEPVITGQVPGSSYLPRTTTIPGYFAAATLWLIGAGFFHLAAPPSHTLNASSAAHHPGIPCTPAPGAAELEAMKTPGARRCG